MFTKKVNNLKTLRTFDPDKQCKLSLKKATCANYMRRARQKDFARDIDMQPTMLNEVIKGKRSVTADIALLLEEALDIAADFWLNFQNQYDLDQARIRDRNTQKLQRSQKRAVSGNLFEQRHKR